MTTIKAYWKLLAMAGLVSYFIACSPVRFSHQKILCRNSGVSCTPTGFGTEIYEQEKIVGNGIVDILFVNDNSGSMSFEQNQMGSKFPNFITSLGQIDWRIGMITTDISGLTGSPATAANGNGAWRDGKPLVFGNGATYIDKNTANASTLFNNLVRRQETLTCEQSGYQPAQCPSSDERGIYAANLFLNSYRSQVLRSAAPLAIIVLSDEDVRSGLYSTRSSSYAGSRNNTNAAYGYELASGDQPDNLVANFKSIYPSKSISVHSIVIKNNDTTCLNAQNSQGANISGSYGKKYQEASQLTGGVQGSICSSNYGNELGQIAYEIQNQVTSMAFVCRPKNDDFTWSAIPAAPSVSATADFDRLVLEFNGTFPPGTKITLSYECDEG
jgi:hypothetical protein